MIKISKVYMIWKCVWIWIFCDKNLLEIHFYDSEIPKSVLTRPIFFDIKFANQIYGYYAIFVISVKCTPDGGSNVPLRVMSCRFRNIYEKPSFFPLCFLTNPHFIANKSVDVYLTAKIGTILNHT